jgi:hypothetical protein
MKNLIASTVAQITSTSVRALSVATLLVTATLASGCAANTDAEDAAESNLGGFDTFVFTGRLVVNQKPDEAAAETFATVRIVPGWAGGAPPFLFENVASLEVNAAGYKCKVRHGMLKIPRRSDSEPEGGLVGDSKPNSACSLVKDGKPVAIRQGGLKLAADRSQVGFFLFLEDGTTLGGQAWGLKP